MKQTIAEEMNIQDEWYKEADTMTMDIMTVRSAALSVLCRNVNGWQQRLRRRV